MPKLLTLEDWIKAYVEKHPINAHAFVGDNIEDTLFEYLSEFAGTLMTAAVAQKLLQEALAPQPEDEK
jgi:hypothetical protein